MRSRREAAERQSGSRVPHTTGQMDQGRVHVGSASPRESTRPPAAVSLEDITPQHDLITTHEGKARCHSNECRETEEPNEHAAAGARDPGALCPSNHGAAPLKPAVCCPSPATGRKSSFNAVTKITKNKLSALYGMKLFPLCI